MTNFLLLLNICIQFIFFFIMALLGISYNGMSESPVYIFTVLGLDCFTFIYILIYECIHHKHVTKGTFVWYFIPFIIVFFYLLDCAFSAPLGQISHKTFQFFLVFSVPAIFIANFVYRYDRLSDLLKNADILMLIVTISILRNLPRMVSTGDCSIGGASYQVLSYISALALGITLFNFLGGRQFLRYSIFQTQFYRYLSLLFLLVQFFAVLISGGRGGMVLLILNVCFAFYYLARNQITNLFLFVFLIIPLIWIFSLNISNSGLSDIVNHGVDRIFSYVSSSGIDMSETSGRDVVYTTAWELISQRPLLGYGFFKQYDAMNSSIHNPYCHNIFLELLLQGGCIFLIISVFLFLHLLNKIRLILKNKKYQSILPFALYPFTMLLFSGTYVSDSIFWFVLVYAMNFKSHCR